jgi:uncharacterized protein (TIGR02147 family)
MRHEKPFSEEKNIPASFSIREARDVCIKFLDLELSTRIIRNPGYSLRAFARDLDVSPASLSNILAGKQSISKRLAENISESIFLPGSSKELFVLSAEYSSSRSLTSRRILKQQIIAMMRDEKSQMDLEAFSVIQDPIHFAVLESLKLPKLMGEIGMIADFLGVEVDKTKKALERLTTLGLTQITENRFTGTVEATYTFPKAPNRAVQNYHAAVLGRAIESLNDKLEKRTFCSVLTACNREERKKIEERLYDFVKKIELELESSSAPKDDVCAIGFFNYSLERPSHEDRNLN